MTITKKSAGALIVGVVILAGGIFLLKTLACGEKPAASQPVNLANSENVEYEPSSCWYTGKVVLGGKQTVSLKYRRFKTPIDITAQFKCTPGLTTSPLQSVLTNTYMQINRQKDFLKCYSDPKSIQRLMTEYCDSSLEKYFDCSTHAFIGGRYLGEIVYKDTTFVIFQLPNERNIPSFTRVSVAKAGDKFLLKSGNLDDAVIMNLSADNYSLVTGMPPDIPAVSQPATATTDQQKQANGQCDPFVVLKPGYAVMIPDPADKGAHFAPLKPISSPNKSATKP